MNNFYHRGSLGDIIYSLSCVKQFNKSNFIFKNKYYHDFFFNLFKSQDYINNLYYLGDNSIEWSDITFNLDGFRTIHKKDLSKPLVVCFKELLNLKDVDFSKPWLHNIPSKKSFPILINRTNRYHDVEDIDWKLLQSVKNNCGFIGSNKEHRQFISLTNLNIPYVKTTDALSVAELINGCDLFIGNQSFCYSISESLKKDRVLEICFAKPNCGPFSENGCSSDKLLSKLQEKKYL